MRAYFEQHYYHCGSKGLITLKLLLSSLSLLVSFTLLTGFIDIWQDTTIQVGQTSVNNSAIGSDVHRIIGLHRDEAIKLNDFAEIYNKIAYDQKRSQAERCEALIPAAINSIQQREKSFAGMHEANCTPDATVEVPELQMIIWPHIRFDYRFIITFKPTN